MVSLYDLALSMPTPSLAIDSQGMKLLWILASVYALGAVPMVYLRPNLYNYDATYLKENDTQWPPFMRNWDLAHDCKDNTVFFPVIW